MAQVLECLGTGIERPEHVVLVAHIGISQARYHGKHGQKLGIGRLQTNIVA